ncbi:MAG: RNA polymerase sigma factor [Nannocystaceae bacterium]|nr:RNA polymerase sigma factor [Nannocystaceae bacterium]
MAEEMDDGALLDRWIDKDTAAGRSLVERHFESVHRFFRSKIDRGAEDLTQRVFAACVAEPQRFRGEGTFRAYLLGIARHILFNHFRKQRREVRALDFGVVSMEELQPSPTSALAMRGEMRLLHAALRRLPLDLQIVLELHYWEGATTAEIARIVEVPVGTVKTRLARARRRLGREIEAARAEPGLIESTLNGVEGWLEGIRQLY